MAASTAASAGRRGPALLGLAGALLSAAGDVLILGRSCSGREFDQAAGRVPSHVDVDTDDRWRSLWNGAALPAGRLRAGALIGCAGIGLLQGPALRGISRTLPVGRERQVAGLAAGVFAVSGVLTHQCCTTVVQAYQRAGVQGPGSPPVPRRPPRSCSRLLGVSAVASLASLAAFSAGLAVAAVRGGAPARWRSAVTPFPCVLAALLTTGALPAPVGGYLRPASISAGLVAYFAVTALPSRAQDAW